MPILRKGRLISESRLIPDTEATYPLILVDDTICVLIVDDERHTREGILSALDWKALGVERVVQARDGIDALTQFRDNSPAIMICDVRMPRMNGVDLAGAVARTHPDTQIIFLSGYSDKEYLRAAIRLHAVDYLEKPIQKRDLTRAVSKALENLRDLSPRPPVEDGSDRIIRRAARDLSDPHTDVLPLIESIDAGEIPFSLTGNYASALIRYDSDGSEARLPEHDVSRAIDRALVSAEARCLHATGKREIILHFALQPEVTLDGLENVVAAIHQVICSTIDSDRVGGAIGLRVHELTRIHESLAAARVAMERVYFRGYREIHRYRKHRTVMLEEDAKGLADEIGEAISRSDLAEAGSLIDDLVGRMSHTPGLPQERARDLLARIVLFLQGLTAELSGLAEHSDGTDSSDELLWSRVIRCVTLRDAADELQGHVAHLCQISEGINRLGRRIHDTVSYLKLTYADDTTVADLARRVDVSPNYLSTHFREKIGKTISQFVTDLRIEQARALLRDPGAPIYRIAMAVGYRDHRYFTRVFKTATGMTPRQYRKTHA